MRSAVVATSIGLTYQMNVREQTGSLDGSFIVSCADRPATFAGALALLEARSAQPRGTHGDLRDRGRMDGERILA